MKKMRIKKIGIKKIIPIMVLIIIAINIIYIFVPKPITYILTEGGYYEYFCEFEPAIAKQVSNGISRFVRLFGSIEDVAVVPVRALESGSVRVKISCMGDYQMEDSEPIYIETKTLHIDSHGNFKEKKNWDYIFHAYHTNLFVIEICLFVLIIYAALCLPSGKRQRAFGIYVILSSICLSVLFNRDEVEEYTFKVVIWDVMWGVSPWIQKLLVLLYPVGVCVINIWYVLISRCTHFYANKKKRILGRLARLFTIVMFFYYTIPIMVCIYGRWVFWMWLMLCMSVWKMRKYQV